MKTLVIGLGNPLLGDDGIGWKVASAVESRLEASGILDSIDVEYLSLGGLSLMERLIGYERAVLIDAIQTGLDQEGSVHEYDIAELPVTATSHLSSSHDTNLQNALILGRSLGAQLPAQITVVAIEAGCVYDFNEQLSPGVAAAVEPAALAALTILKQESLTAPDWQARFSTQGGSEL